MRKNIQPTIALSFYCLKKFNPELLGIFNYAINYHNGSLPGDRGKNATSWSLYQEEQYSGFTFHCMTEELDTGNILVQEKLPVASYCNLFDLEMENAHWAVKYIPDILQMACDDHPGKPQQGEKSYHSRNDSLSVTTIPDPSSLSKMELIRRLTAFEKPDMKLSGKWYEVTGIREVYWRCDKQNNLTFVTSDALTMKAEHFLYLPLALYLIYRWWNKMFQKNKPSPAQK